MRKLPEPDNVEFFVGGIEPDTTAAIDTARFIEEYKNRSDYPVEAEEAERLLAALGIDARDYGMPDAQSLLEHWQGCVAELPKADPGRPNGAGIDKKDLGVTGSSKEAQG